MKIISRHKGASLFELVIYVALLATVLLVIYELFVLSVTKRLDSVTQSEIYTNALKVMFDLRQTVPNAGNIVSPAVGTNGPILTLNGGAIIYRINGGSGILEKVENSELNNLTNREVIVENLRFETLGPSLLQPTVKVTFTIRSKQVASGQPDRENFQTSVTLR